MRNKNKHFGELFDRIRDLRGIDVVHADGQNIVMVPFPTVKLSTEDCFKGVSAHLKSQGITLQVPTSSTVTRKKLGKHVLSVEGVDNEETPPHLSIWMRSPTKGDIATRAVKTAVVLEKRLLSKSDPKFIQFLGKPLIQFASRLPAVQIAMLR